MLQNHKLSLIPDYCITDNLKQRVSSLVLFEQYSDTRTITAETINELSQIIKMVDRNNEMKLSKVAKIILTHCQKYETIK